MKPITLKKALNLYVDAVLENDLAPQLYLKDENSYYHNVDEIDLNGDRIRCDDTYWDYYEYIMEAEGGKDHKLFVKENDNAKSI